MPRVKGEVHNQKDRETSKRDFRQTLFRLVHDLQHEGDEHQVNRENGSEEGPGERLRAAEHDRCHRGVAHPTEHRDHGKLKQARDGDHHAERGKDGRRERHVREVPDTFPDTFVPFVVG